MYLPFWKNALSFLWPVLIEKSSSEYNESLEVTLQNGKLLLNTQNANYSFGLLHEVMIKAIGHAVIHYNKVPRKVLLLGYGGGSAAAVLKGNFPDSEITAVEIDSEVISLAKRYFFTRDVEMILSDAKEYVQQSSHEFDLIIVDVFIDVTVPDFVLEKEFLQHCKNRLTSNGLCIMNVLESKSKVKATTGLFSTVFQNVTEFRLFGQNHLLFGTR